MWSEREAEPRIYPPGCGAEPRIYPAERGGGAPFVVGVRGRASHVLNRGAGRSPTAFCAFLRRAAGKFKKSKSDFPFSIDF